MEFYFNLLALGPLLWGDSDYQIFPVPVWAKVGGNWEELAENTDDFSHFYGSFYNFANFSQAQCGQKLGKIGKNTKDFSYLSSFFTFANFS